MKGDQNDRERLEENGQRRRRERCLVEEGRGGETEGSAEDRQRSMRLLQRRRMRYKADKSHGRDLSDICY